MTGFYINGIGVAAAGMPDWPTAARVLRGETPFVAEPVKLNKTALLPANEARRAGKRVLLAFQAAEQACEGVAASSLATVFVSEVADTRITDRICRDIIDPGRAVSPTQFHNSVHNTASGYWSIATGSQAASNSLSGGREGFAVGLCESWGMLASGEHDSVLLVCFEHLGEDGNAIDRARPPIYGSFAVALRLGLQREGQAPRLSPPRPVADAPTRMANEGLETFRVSNAAAGALPLLKALAEGCDDTLVLETLKGGLRVDMRCNDD